MLLDELEKVWYSGLMLATLTKIHIFVRFVYYDHLGNPRPKLEASTLSIFNKLKEKL